MSRAIAQCPRHFGHPLSNCSVCKIGGVFELPRAESAKRMHEATTTAQARARRIVAVKEKRLIWAGA